MSIPNNIGLDESSTLAKLLVSYQKKFRRWWRQRGPAEFLDQPMRLRVPTGIVRGSGWAEFTTMRPNDYCWGLFTAPTNQEHIAFGEHQGKKVWETVPAEYRTLLLEHICVQGDVENAAIEQSRTLTQTAPSGHDLENLFQFFLEEGRHTWAMVHLLLDHFGPDGVVEAEALLERMSGDTENPRLLKAFNYQTDDWLSHFMWCFLADRVGKYQIQAVTQSAFAPLARSAKFMMFEEPLHITFGAVGLERVLCKSAEITIREDTYEIVDAGAVPLPVIQKYLNYWVPKVYDLLGNDESHRSYDLYRSGIRVPRGFESDRHDVRIDVRVGDRIEQAMVRPEKATNAIMRQQFIAELQRIVVRWNVCLKNLGVDFELRLPHERFNRTYGPCTGLPFDINGVLIADDADAKISSYFPTPSEMSAVRSVMQRELAPDCVASWIASSSTRFGDAVTNRVNPSPLQ
ncbi:benzoyl-CoA 2,3-epoxidase subunit BoxB [Sorangium sp. So ce131]|uniref:benzoyl-CoA 2,3-epoxidase subunit BoxB n=1 Tax=Sorangium sp. So ce131 TaxID=3133282 RepID=UPI003F5E4E12